MLFSFDSCSLQTPLVCHLAIVYVQYILPPEITTPYSPPSLPIKIESFACLTGSVLWVFVNI
jgi:hypothetical protein